MKRNSKYTERLTTRCDFELYKKIQVMAKQYQVKRGVIMRTLILKAIADYEAENGEIDLAR